MYEHLISPNIIFQSTINGNENKENDNTVKKIFIVKQILLISTKANVWRTVWKMYKLIPGSKRVVR